MLSFGKKLSKVAVSLLLALTTVITANPVITVSAAVPSVQPDAPATKKHLHDNGDGTYTLSLSVTGKSDTSTITNVNKANVILVIDTSSSMNYDAAAGTTADPHVYYTVNGTPGNPSSGGGVNPTY